VATRDRAYGVRQGEQQEAESKAHANLANLAYDVDPKDG
jgi:hypothetical protein